MKPLVIGLWLAIVGLGFQPATQAATSCGEPCLRTHMDNYLDALLAHDPSRIPRAKKFRATENGVDTTMEDGLWATATGAVGYRIYVPDVPKQTIAFMGNVTEFGKTIYFGVRLKLVDDRIAEAETAVARGVVFPPIPGKEPLAALHSARASLAELAPEADRLPRAKLVELSEKYFDALQDGDGDLAPFAIECVRIENGFAPPEPPPGTKRESCYDNIEHSPPFTRIVKRRVLAVDESRNTVMWVSDFSMPGVESPRLKEWRRTTSPEMLNMLDTSVRPSSGPVFELFRIRHGQLAEIEAVYYFPRLPYGFGTGWDRP